MSHLDDTFIAQYAAAETHLASCGTCRSALEGYRRLVVDLSAPPAPRHVRDRIVETLRQRVRLKRFVQRLVSDPAWRAHVEQDPQGALERHHIRPTPQLVAALRELSSAEEIATGQLDERISKLIAPM